MTYWYLSWLAASGAHGFATSMSSDKDFPFLHTMQALSNGLKQLVHVTFYAQISEQQFNMLKSINGTVEWTVPGVQAVTPPPATVGSNVVRLFENKPVDVPPSA